MNADWHGFATETALLYPVNMVLRCNVLIAMRPSTLICVHLRICGFKVHRRQVVCGRREMCYAFRVSPMKEIAS